MNVTWFSKQIIVYPIICDAKVEHHVTWQTNNHRFKMNPPRVLLALLTHFVASSHYISLHKSKWLSHFDFYNELFLLERVESWNVWDIYTFRLLQDKRISIKQVLLAPLSHYAASSHYIGQNDWVILTFKMSCFPWRSQKLKCETCLHISTFAR